MRRIITIILLLTLPAATVGGKDHKFAARCPPSSLTMQEMFDMQHTYEALWQVHLEKRLETEGAYTESAARRFGELCPGNGAVAATAADAPADSRHDDVAAATTSAAPAAVAAPAPAAPAAPAAARSVTEAPPLPPPPSSSSSPYYHHRTRRHQRLHNASNSIASLLAARPQPKIALCRVSGWVSD